MGGMNENGQPPMAAMAELLKCASHGCKATVGIKLCSAPGCNKYRCISCVENLISKHGLESVNDPDDNLPKQFLQFQKIPKYHRLMQNGETPFFIFATRNVMKW